MSLIGTLTTLVLLWTVPTAATLLVASGLKVLDRPRSGSGTDVTEEGTPSG